ncbi:zinc finger protein 484 [Caerostris extrusa]|uniref:Zinc finger protein 484 n=1 Tax=Caerostris extrusa TaxID=172846 RepID=A0AAV4SYP5_CAEEX|nr:zinc finger protein 484 [Caerostris extrusa]
MFVVNATKIENGTTRLTVVPHICGICKKAFLQEKALLEHFKTHADGDNATVTLSSTEIEKEVLKTANKLHTCDLCNRNFSTNAYLQKHLILHAGEKPHECPICHKTFALKDNLQKHYRVHDPMKQRYFCSECEKSMLSDIGCNEESEKSEIKVEDDEWMDEESEIISEEDE